MLPYQIYQQDGQFWFCVWNGAEWYTPQDADGYDTAEDAREGAVAYMVSVS